MDGMDAAKHAIEELQSGHLEHSEAVREALTSITETLKDLVDAVNDLHARVQALEGK